MSRKFSKKCYLIKSITYKCIIIKLQSYRYKSLRLDWFSNGSTSGRKSLAAPVEDVMDSARFEIHKLAECFISWIEYLSLEWSRVFVRDLELRHDVRSYMKLRALRFKATILDTITTVKLNVLGNYLRYSIAINGHLLVWWFYINIWFFWVESVNMSISIMSERQICPYQDIITLSNISNVSIFLSNVMKGIVIGYSYYSLWVIRPHATNYATLTLLLFFSFLSLFLVLFGFFVRMPTAVYATNIIFLWRVYLHEVT